MCNPNEQLQYISTILNDVANLYTETQNTLLVNTKCCINDIHSKNASNATITKNSIDSLLNEIIVANITFEQKIRFDLLEFDKMLVWHQLYLADEEKHRLDGHNFNVFRLFAEQLNINIRETMHSKLLKFLLDKNASHGQGVKFLQILLNKLNICQPEEGQWEVTAEQGRIDILIKRKKPHSIIVIENKSNWANDQPNQLYRYWRDQIYPSVNKVDNEFYKKNIDRYQIIYLAPNRYKNVEEQSLLRPSDCTDNSLPSKIPLLPKIFTFDVFIQDWLLDCENELRENNRVRQYIAQYRELCKTL